MAYEIKIPRLGWNMDEGDFVEWLKRDGERVEAGEALFAIEGDKAVAEVEALDSGILRIPPDGPKKGDTLPVGHVIGYLVEAGEEIPTSAPRSASPPVAAAPLAPARPVSTELDEMFYPSEPVAQAAPIPPARGGAAVPDGAIDEAPTISPRAARLAAALGIDWREVRGTGSSGRVRERDIRAAVSSGQR